MINASADIHKPARHFLPKDFQVTTWNKLEPYFKELTERPINSKAELEKWLKDRKGRELSYDDVRHYQRIVKALQETIRLMDEIDAAIPEFPLV